MSGIVGVFNRNGEPVRRETIVSMSDAINHRGPHGHGIWTDGPVGFGHVLLHTTEESLREEQPYSLDGRTWITADARIDDRECLIDLLKAHVHSSVRLKEATDVALLLHAYLAWGVECVDHIIGVFAAAIWDGREQRLVCLRDHIGIKPFYYTQTPNCFVFASEAKGILASGLILQRIYEPRIADYLLERQFEGIDQTCTFFDNIVRLPPAHRLEVSPNKTSVDKYWSLNTTTELSFSDPQEYIQGFREVFYEAVQSSLRSAWPVASMLSGGIDSSSIVASARSILMDSGAKHLSTFSLINNKAENCVETSCIKLVQDQVGLDCFDIEVEDIGKFSEEIWGLSEITDDIFDWNLNVLQIMYSEAKKNGFTVLLDGLDGDIVIGQPGNHLAYLLQNLKINETLREARATSAFYYRFSGNTLTRLYGASKAAFVPAILRNIKRHWRHRRTETSLSKILRNTIINPTFARQIDLLGRLKLYEIHSQAPIRIDLRRNHIRALEHPHTVAAVERYDRIASVYSIEPRHPILDRRLVEYCLALPWQQKISEGWTKLIIRKAMEDVLPEKVIWRKGYEHLGLLATEYLMINQFENTRNIVLNGLNEITKYVDVNKIRCIIEGNMPRSDRVDFMNFVNVEDAVALQNWLARWKRH